MADLVVDAGSLVLSLTRVERLEGFRGDLRAPLDDVAAVRAVEDPWPELRGLRAPGTGVPGVMRRRGRGAAGSARTSPPCTARGRRWWSSSRGREFRPLGPDAWTIRTPWSTACRAALPAS